MLRIIAGDRRGAKLRTLDGNATRPLRDRVRESLFNILRDRVPNAAVMDVFAGSGAVGLESLSRGARRAVFFESAPPAISVINDNIRKLRYEDRSTIVKGVVPRTFYSAPREAAGYDLVFIMPPYNSLMGGSCLLVLAEQKLMKPGGWVILEIHKNEEAPERPEWKVVDDRKYGVTRLLFYEFVGEGPPLS